MENNTDIEDLKIWFYDSFLSKDQFQSVKYGTGDITFKPTEIKVSAGITTDSYSYLYYNNIAFNPKYSELILKLNINSKINVKAFWGFKKTLTEPSLNMTETHAGFLIINNKMYITSADGENQQKAQIVGFDPTKIYEYKIKYNKFYYKPLPQVITYLGLPYIERVKREWKLIQINSTYPPEDETHYIFVYVKTSEPSEKYILLNRVIYKEEYPD